MDSSQDAELLAAIKHDLPKFPDQVIETWLLPIASEGYGWPPNQIEQDDWLFVLHAKSLDYWQQTTWALTSTTLELNEFTDLDQKTIVELFQAHVEGKQNAFSAITNGAQRIESAYKFLCQKGVLPVPVVVTETEGGLILTDGNHRVVALTMLRHVFRDDSQQDFFGEQNCRLPEKLQPAWIYTPPSDGDYNPHPFTAASEVTARLMREFADIQPVRKRKPLKVPIRKNKPD